MDINALLTAAGKLLNLPIKLDSETHRCILVDKNSRQEVFIEAPEGDDLLYIYAQLGKVPHDVQMDKFLKSVLELNLFGIQTNGFTISVEPQQDQLMLHFIFPQDILTPQLLVNLLKNFIASIKQMAAKIDDLTTIGRRRAAVAKAQYSPGENAKPKQAMRVIRA
ncbi:MAG: CesT family type III secretion system chaperone [Puniceicoccales bacterium]|jgi:hypothetical protein|nr:CesT family type III secretion system chaperone [Puniceicoccales bacterium]